MHGNQVLMSQFQIIWSMDSVRSDFQKFNNSLICSFHQLSPPDMSPTRVLVKNPPLRLKEWHFKGKGTTEPHVKASHRLCSNATLN